MLQEMEWQVKIEGQNKKRILVSFDPQGELIIFRGQFSIKNKWVDFSTETYAMDITLESIQSMIAKVSDLMNKRLKVYEDLNKSFSIIREVEVQDGSVEITDGKTLVVAADGSTITTI